MQAGGVGLLQQELYSGGSSIEQGRALTAKMLEHEPGLDCIYFSSDLMAVGGLMYALATGLNVPGDIALAGFNNLQILQGLPISLATTDAHRFDIGARAAGIILSTGRGEAEDPQVVRLDTHVHPGQSL